MAIPLLEYAPSTQNSRVSGYEVGGDEQSRIFSTDNLLSSGQIGDLIEAAYRQIFFHAFAADREKFLESQLRSGQITVRDFIRGLSRVLLIIVIKTGARHESSCIQLASSTLSTRLSL